MQNIHKGDMQMSEFEEFIMLLMKHPEAVNRLREIVETGASTSASDLMHFDTNV